MIPAPCKHHAKQAGWMSWAVTEGCRGGTSDISRMTAQGGLFVPKLQCGGGHGEEQGVWSVQIRSRHVRWHDSELPVGMVLLFILLNRIILRIFWPGLCSLPVLWQSLIQSSTCLPALSLAFLKKNSTCLKKMSKTLCLCNTDFTGLNGIMLLCVNWASGLILFRM